MPRLTVAADKSYGSVWGEGEPADLQTCRPAGEPLYTGGAPYRVGRSGGGLEGTGSSRGNSGTG